MSCAHTPGPWYISAFELKSHGKDRVVMGADSFGVAWIMGRTPEEHAADAAHIVRCVNSHEALVEVTRLAIEYDDLLQSHKGPAVLFDGDVAEIDAAYDRWIAAARVALAKGAGV